MISTKQTEILLGLGSNLGDRLSYFKSAILYLQERQIINDIVSSSVHQTKALLPEGGPQEWDLDFLNMAIKGKTTLSPQELLKATKDIEQIIGRTILKRWAPREIDIDILVYGDQVITDQELIIPHPALLERPWIINHIAELMPKWKYPLLGPYYQLSAKEIIKKLQKLID